MSLRVMEDGKTYDRTDCRKNRKRHRVEPIAGVPGKQWTCATCGELWYWARHPVRGDIARHFPGTFWVDDSDRTRW